MKSCSVYTLLVSVEDYLWTKSSIFFKDAKLSTEQQVMKWSEDEWEEESKEEAGKVEDDEGKDELVIPLEHSNPNKLTELQYKWSVVKHRWRFLCVLTLGSSCLLKYCWEEKDKLESTLAPTARKMVVATVVSGKVKKGTSCYNILQCMEQYRYKLYHTICR